MNVLFIAGSAREGSLTAKLCRIAASAMHDSHIEYIMPHEMHIGHCTGCGKCSAANNCVIEDDMHKIYSAVERNDVIILATPVYFSGPSSVIKQVIDRFQCFWVKREGKKKRYAALITAGGGDAPVFSGVLSSAKAFAAAAGAEWIGELMVCGTDGITSVPEDLSERAHDFGSMIAAEYQERASPQRS